MFVRRYGLIQNLFILVAFVAAFCADTWPEYKWHFVAVVTFCGFASIGMLIGLRVFNKR